MNIPWHQRLLSFIVPVNIRNWHSHISGPIELNLYLNQLMLDTKNANYSFGKLHTIMKKAIVTAIKQNPQIKTVLILGFAGGSAAKILNTLLPNANITAIELDPLMIEIYTQYFKSKSLQLLQQNAQQFVATTNNQYDLIICDVFVNKTKPAFTKNSIYYKHISSLLTTQGIFVQNIMNANPLQVHLKTAKNLFVNTHTTKINSYNYLLFANNFN